MTLKLHLLLLFLGQLQCLRTAYIEGDLPEAPLIYQQEQEIEYETSEVEFSYQIDISIINKIKLFYPILEDPCGSSPSIAQFYNTLIHPTMFWNRKRDNGAPNKNIIKLNLYHIQVLNSSYERFQRENNTLEKCKYIPIMTEQMQNLNNELIKLDKSDYSTIRNIILIGDLYTDAYWKSDNISATNFTNIIDFTSPSASNFFQKSKLTIKSIKDNIFLSVKIPFLTRSKLHKIYPKPILYHNTPYILSTNTEYSIESSISPNYFSNLSKHCFFAQNITYCKKPKNQNNCDNQYISQSSNNFNENCFTRLPLRNIITQVKNDIYFLIIEPLTVNITCNGSTNSINLFQSSKILNNNCNINATFFIFDPNSIPAYGIFFSNLTENLSEQKLINKIEHKTAIQFYCFIIFLCIYLNVFGIIIYFYYKLKQKDRTSIRNYLETMV